MLIWSMPPVQHSGLLLHPLGAIEAELVHLVLRNRANASRQPSRSVPVLVAPVPAVPQAWHDEHRRTWAPVGVAVQRCCCVLCVRCHPMGGAASGGGTWERDDPTRSTEFHSSEKEIMI